LQYGFYRFNKKWKQRGLGKLGTREIEHLDTFEKDEKRYYKFKMLRSNRLRSSILSNNISEIGKITEKTREVNLNADKKRMWFESLTGINHKMNRSLPISLNLRLTFLLFTSFLFRRSSNVMSTGFFLSHFHSFFPYRSF